MDLYEHQARELLAEHGIVVPPADVTDSPREARAIAHAARRTGRRQGTGQDRRTRQGRRRPVRGRPGRGGADDPADPRHGHQGPPRPHRDAGPTRRHRRRVLCRVRPRPDPRTVPRRPLHRGRHGHRGGGRDPARGGDPRPRRPDRGRHPGDGGRHRQDRRTPRAGRRRPRTALAGAHPRGRPPRRGEPLALTARGLPRPSTPRSPSTTTHASARPVGASGTPRTTTPWRRPPRPEGSPT